MAINVFGLIPLVFGIIFAGIGIALPIYRKKKEKEFAENGIPVTAAINNVWRTGAGNNRRLHASVVFHTKDNKEITTELPVVSTRMKIGQHIDIRYHKDDAYNVYVESAVITNILTVIFCVTGLAFIGVGLFVMSKPALL